MKIDAYQHTLVTINLHFLRYHMNEGRKKKAEYYALRILEIAEEIWLS